MAETLPQPQPQPPGWDAHVHVFDSAAPAREGHYTPGTRTLAEIETVGARSGIGHVVLVQPSVYGTDNSVLLRALRTQPGRHRGVAVLDADVPDAQMDTLHRAGVRGIRFNLVSPVGNGHAGLKALAPRLRERGWHVQWYARPHELAELVPLQRATGLCFVLDHLAGVGIGGPVPPQHWQALDALADGGAWIKLSGWYRLGCEQPYMAMVPLIQRAVARFGQRLVWGSDWPHTSLPSTGMPSYDGLLAPVRSALGGETLQAVLERHPALLYGAATSSN